MLIAQCSMSRAKCKIFQNSLKRRIREKFILIMVFSLEPSEKLSKMKWTLKWANSIPISQKKLSKFAHLEIVKWFWTVERNWAMIGEQYHKTVCPSTKSNPSYVTTIKIFLKMYIGDCDPHWVFSLPLRSVEPLNTDFPEFFKNWNSLPKSYEGNMK